MTHTDRRVLHDISLPHLAPGTTFRHPGGTPCYCRSGSDSLTLPPERLVLTTACICQRLKPEHWTFPLARAAIFRAILFLLLVCNLSATCGNTSFDDSHEGEHRWRIMIDSQTSHTPTSRRTLFLPFGKTRAFVCWRPRRPSELLKPRSTIFLPMCVPCAYSPR